MSLLAFVVVNFASCNKDDHEKDDTPATVYGPWQVLNLDLDGVSRFFVFEINGEMKSIDAVYGENNKLADVQVTDGFFKIDGDELSTSLWGGQKFTVDVDKHSLVLKNSKTNYTCTRITQSMIDDLLKWKPSGMSSLVGGAWYYGAEDFGGWTQQRYLVYQDDGTCREYLVWFEKDVFDNCEYKDYYWKIDAGRFYLKTLDAKDWGAGTNCAVTATTFSLDGAEVAVRCDLTSELKGWFAKANPAV